VSDSKIIESIPEGEANAISKKRLAEITGLSYERIKKKIREIEVESQFVFSKLQINEKGQNEKYYYKQD